VSKSISTFSCGAMTTLLTSISHAFLASLVESTLSYGTGPERKDQLCLIVEGTPVDLVSFLEGEMTPHNVTSLFSIS